MNNWYHNTKSDAVQGLVIEENTGRTVAVAYDPKDTALLAAAPALLTTLRQLVGTLDRSKCATDTREVMRDADSLMSEL
jgi:hypothetical protein